MAVRNARRIPRDSRRLRRGAAYAKRNDANDLP
jgi:hypothetical protein